MSFALSHDFPVAGFGIANVSSSKETQVIGLDLLPLQRKIANGQQGNNNIPSTGEMSFEMIKWKRLAMSAPVNQKGQGYMASCSVATICTVFLVWPVAWLLLFQTPREGQRSVMLRGCCESPRQPRLLWADPNSCCHTRLLWRHREDWEPSNRAKFLHLQRRSRQYTQRGAWRLACPMMLQHIFDSFQIHTRPLVTLNIFCTL